MYELKVRGASDKTENLRKKALGNGAINVTTRIYSPNVNESTFIFKKKADLNKFAGFIKKLRDIEEVAN